MGVEPTSKAWEAFILPMNYACVFFFESFSIITQLSPFGKGENEKISLRFSGGRKKQGGKAGERGGRGRFPLEKKGEK